MRSFGKGICVVGLALGCSLLVWQDRAPYTHAQSVDEIQAQIDEINKQRAALEKEIAQYQQQINTLSGERQTLQGSIKTLDISRSQTAAKIADIEKKIDGATLKLDKLSLEIGDKEESIALDQAAVAASLRAINTTDDTTLVEMILGAGDLTEAWVAVDNLTALSSALRSHTNALSEAKVALADQQASVVSTRNELSSANDDLGSQKRALDVNRQEKQSLLTQTQSQEAQYQSLVAQKRAEQASFEAALFELASRLQYNADPSAIPSAGSGVLRWPLDSVNITQQFGRTADSGRLYASGTHDGIDLSAAVGTPVRAALGGTVYEINEGAVQNCQYGKWVLIKHANGLATLYAHLSSINVSKGSTVSSGQVIGYSGMTGYATGPHLHFTVYQATAVTLKQYTCKSGYTVTIPIAAPEAYLNPMSYL